MLKELLLVVASALPFSNGLTSGDHIEFIDCGTEIIYVEPSAVSPMSVGLHPEIPGFDWVYSFDAPRYIDDDRETNKIGYMHMDLDLYTTRFTDKSCLLLMHTKTECTSGNTASKLFENFNARLDLDSIKVLTEVPQMKDNSNGYTTGSVHLLEYWPHSDNVSETTIASTTGLGLTLGSGFEIGIEAGDATLKLSPSGGLTINFGKQAINSETEPFLDSGRSPKTDDWPFNSYYFNVQYDGLGKVTYTFETYSLFEIIDDEIGFNEFSFVAIYDATMDVVENKDLPIKEWPFLEKHYELYKGTQIRFNLGYDPSNVTFFNTLN
ncbi:MAG: hypothetical protein IAC61_04145 [Firmicutes bacterium]|uniref:Uncharacterized protein n=1 Tax=Candidatus Alloenteromonas pullistercoris TaxID=2840785 RepID=A0A9D9DJV9_9FIRM|nr:hypothetical protein [Candidatus Enteromonas pullistercoris]